MTVQTILKIKGDAIFTASPTQTLAQVAQLLSEKGIGAVVVTGIDKNVLGILSERDIVRAIAKGGAGVLDESVARHMTSKVVTSTMSTPIAKVMELMTVGKFRHGTPARHSGAVAIKDGLDTQPIINRRATHMPLASGSQSLYPHPLASRKA
jgi:CBS domain-containing protein